MVAIRDFSGLLSSPWALASAAAMAPMVSLERCMVRLHLHHLKADRPRFGPFGAQAMAGRLLGILRDQLLQVSLGALMFLVGRSGAPEGDRELCPAVRGTHIDDTDRLQPRPWRLDPEQPGLLAAHHAAPELLLSGQ